MAVAAPSSASGFIRLLRQSGLLAPADIDEALAELNLHGDAYGCANTLVQAQLLTSFQAQHLLSGRFRGLVLGPYRLLRKLGKGGMGVVYLAEHTTLDRRVALKVLNSEQANEEMGLERFFREARAAAALEHKHIVRLYDVSHVDGVHFLVMEYMDGTDLHSLLQKTGRMHYAQAVDYVVQAAHGLRHAHAKGFVHRDIKPANLMLSTDGTVKILDMGLARRATGRNDELTGKLGEDVVTGTLDYLSPEQAIAAPVDERGDIYSLGATLYTLIVGKPPYSGNTTQKLTQHQFAPPPSLCKARPEVPAELDAVLARMMAKNVDQRYASAEEVIEALAPWTEAASAASRTTATTTAALTTPMSKPSPPPKPDKRRRWIVAATVAFACVAGLVLALATGKKGEPPAVAEAPKGEPPAVAPVAPKTEPKAEPPVVPPPPPPAVYYRLDLSAAKPFSQENTGRTVNVPDAPAPHPDAPAGWFTHSWINVCTHEFFGHKLDGRPVIGVRLTAGPEAGRPEAMLFLRSIPVPPNKPVELRVEYMATGGFTPADVRAAPATAEARRNLKVLGRLGATGDRWETATFRFVTPNADAIQIEFHHYGPLAPGNDLLLRAVELVGE